MKTDPTQSHLLTTRICFIQERCQLTKSIQSTSHGYRIKGRKQRELHQSECISCAGDLPRIVSKRLNGQQRRDLPAVAARLLLISEARRPSAARILREDVESSDPDTLNVW